MIDELETLRRYLDVTVDPDPDLGPSRQRLVTAIEEEGGNARAGRRRSPGSHRTNRRRALAIGGLAAAGVAAAAVALLVLVPTAPHSAPRATTKPFPSHLPVGDQLRLLADRAGNQPIPHLRAGQALYTQAGLSVVGSVNNGAAQATIGLSVQKWSTASGQTCTTLTALPAQFASPSERTAWVGLHLPRDSGSPVGQPVPAGRWRGGASRRHHRGRAADRRFVAPHRPRHPGPGARVGDHRHPRLGPAVA